MKTLVREIFVFETVIYTFTEVKVVIKKRLFEKKEERINRKYRCKMGRVEELRWYLSIQSPF